MKLKATTISHVHSLYQWCSHLLDRTALLHLLLLLLVVADFLEEHVQAAFGKPPLLLYNPIFIIHCNVSLHLSHGDEVLLGMGPYLCTGAGADEFLDFAPVLTVETNSLQKFVVLRFCPATFQGLVVRGDVMLYQADRGPYCNTHSSSDRFTTGVEAWSALRHLLRLLDNVALMEAANGHWCLK